MSGRKPKKIHTDQGNEFFDKKAELYFKNLNIEPYSINSDTKAAVVERFNRTIKERMWKIFTFKNNYRYIDILDDLIKYLRRFISIMICSITFIIIKK